MDKKQAQQQISDIFSHSFDRERYTAFLGNLLNKVEPRDGHYTGNYVPEAYREHVNQYWRIGKYTDPDGEELDLLVVEVKSLAKLDRARSALRNFAINRLKQFEKEASLIAFYAKDDGGADWRFSFVKIEHEAFKDDKGKVKLKEQLTPAKRYSYLVGAHENSHTACKQLLPVLAMDYADPRVEEIEAAFSIEKVTDEFFEQYKALFQKLGEHLKREPWFQRESDEEQDHLVTRFAKKLLGQIVFLYFLQKKGWLGAGKDQPWGTGPKNFMRKRFGAKTDSQNFYRDCLQYLFYEALADERKGQEDPGYYERFDCRLPFLNGGLFEADYDWRNETITIPDSIFHNADKTKAGDVGTGILDVFDRYNFTIKEDEPLDKEVAVDPEMLGKVFENMLEVTERKGKGAFYTPREIVHYMCQESLIHYLEKVVGPDTDSAIPKADLEWLIRHGHLALENDQRVLNAGRETATYSFSSPDAIRQQAAAIDAALADIKVCDPAIGSGAFPVGMLHEIVHAREVLSVLQSAPIRPYDLKKHAIGNSIYGVDIDPSAIDIARLRLWLSLIVDEDDYATIDALPNLDYKIMQGNSLIEEFEGVKLFDDAFIQDETSDPLAEEKAKLEQRRVEIQREYMEGLQAGEIFDARREELDAELLDINNSLAKIEKAEKKAAKKALKKGDPLFELISEARKKAKRLEARQEEFFGASSAEQKRQLRDEITRLEWELIEATLKEQGKTDALAKLEGFMTSGEKPYFLWKLNFSEVFRQNGGFDVVIGNPPYLRIQGIREHDPDIADAYKRLFKSATGSFDLYVLFMERGTEVIHEDGVLNFICPDKWINSSFGKGIRKEISRRQNAIKLISFGEHQVFSAHTYSSLVWLGRRAKSDIHYVKIAPNKHSQINLDKELLSLEPKRFTENPYSGLDEKPWILAQGDHSKAMLGLMNHKQTLQEKIKIFVGLQTSKDSIYFLKDAQKKGDVFEVDSKELGKRFQIEPGLIKPLLLGDQVHRYEQLKSKNLVLFPYHVDRPGEKPKLMKASFIKENFPLGWAYLKECEAILRGRERGRFDGSEWHQFGRKQGISFGSVKKLLAPDISLGGNFSYDREGDFYTTTTLYGYIKSEDTWESYEFLLGMLNSTLLWFYLKNSGSVLANGYYRYKPAYLNNFPIPEVDRNQEASIAIISSYLLRLGGKKGSHQLQYAYFEQLIDGLVYELYFPDEISAAGKEILSHLGELLPIDESMSDEKKLAIIQREFDRLYDPNHPVRNHLETLDSVPVVQTIREALKR